MSTYKDQSVVYFLYVMIATHQQYIITSVYLALAGVIALLLCLVLLSAVSTYLVHRKGKRNSQLANCELLECKSDDPDHPYHYTQLNAAQKNGPGKGRTSSTSDNYAKPFNPGKGISLSRHCLSSIGGSLNRSTSQTSVDKSETVSTDPFGLVTGYTYIPGQAAADESGDNPSGEYYQANRFQNDETNRLEKYNVDNDDEYIAPALISNTDRDM